ncbi:MAG TPA: hypothetical protein VGK28_13205 [Candidatus Dormibacteraeota bacterium]
MTAADVRVPYVRWLVVVAALLVCAFLLWVTRTFTFYFDEWSFILTAPDWTPATYFEPHNEHPSMLLRVVYAVLLNTVGLRSYLPYMALLYVAHLANAVLLFELVRRRSGDLPALAAALLLLVLGAGWEDLFWAWQMAWLASVALGLGALLLVQKSSGPRLAAAIALLAASLSFSGIGVPFATAVAVHLALTPGRRRDLLALVPLGAALVVWYVLFGRFAQHPDPQPTAANLLLDPLYAAWGLSQGLGGVIGLGGWIGLPLLAAAMAALAWRWKTRPPEALTVAVAAGLLAFYLVAGLTRAQLGVQQSGASRYVYVAAVLWLILLTDAARAVAWRGTWRPALTACLFLACFNNAVVLYEFGLAKTVQMQRAVADLQALAATRNDSCLNETGNVDLLVMPDVLPPAYYRAVDRYGDPAAGMPVTDRVDFEVARANLRKAGC